MFSHEITEQIHCHTQNFGQEGVLTSSLLPKAQAFFLFFPLKTLIRLIYGSYLCLILILNKNSHGIHLVIYI